MKLEFVANTGMYLEHGGTVLGMDLWLTQGAFEGSWFHYPPLRETKHKVADCDYIYISHIHPDHCDFHALATARRDAKFVVPNYFGRLIERKLRAFGFRNVVSLGGGESTELGSGLRVKLYPQFVNNLFHEAAIGSLIDSALLIEWDGRAILNCNDNYLTPEWAAKLKRELPPLDLLMSPHSASGPYPASFRNLSTGEKAAEAKRLQTQYIGHWVNTTSTLAPRLVVPCAAEYVVVGELAEKNPYIGLAEAKDAVAALLARQGGPAPVRPIQLDCGTVLDVDTGEVSGLPVRNPAAEDRQAFAKAHRAIPFDYHWEDSFTDANFDELVASARANLWEKQARLDWKRDYNVYLTIDETPRYAFNFSREGFDVLNGDASKRLEPYLECFLPRPLFYQILTRRAHWNNAEGGLHIDFFRKPNDYIPEVFTLLAFLQA